MFPFYKTTVDYFYYQIYSYIYLSTMCLTIWQKQTEQFVFQFFSVVIFFSLILNHSRLKPLNASFLLLRGKVFFFFFQIQDTLVVFPSFMWVKSDPHFLNGFQHECLMWVCPGAGSYGLKIKSMIFFTKNSNYDFFQNIFPTF